MFYICCLLAVLTKNLSELMGLSSATISRLKMKLRGLYYLYLNDRPVILGGPDVVVEVDETVISGRGCILNPKPTSDIRTSFFVFWGQSIIRQ